MENEFIEIVKQQSDQELKDIVINFPSYQGKLVLAAKNELINRGVELSKEEKEKRELIKEKRIKETKNEKVFLSSWDLFSPKWKKNIVNDIDAPQLYSREVILSFSILFTVAFAGILLAKNLITINNRKAIFPVILFSILFTGIIVYILNIFPGFKAFVLLLNIIGGSVLYNYFWSKFIGKDFKYRTKPYWIPVIIGITLYSFLIWLAYLGQ